MTDAFSFTYLKPFDPAKMKNKSIYVAALFFLIQSVFLPIGHGDANLIEQTCRQTPDRNLCVSSLKADPRSATADVTGLALIMVDVVKNKATLCANRINDLLKQKPGDQALSSCKSDYNAVLIADVPVAVEALTKGDPKFAEQSMDDTAIEAKSCEDGFKGRSPMTDLNNASQKFAAVAAAIVRLLL
ncbi:cell wall / vacuolar inhibitor of fructosidase 1-like [Argentina anserina]|uniref:cell wall / vacuolar inhibitor of fructosidase 1-like n=1 Tax=Argentina anserina TaxID=57926 RepID=UPI0021768D40|nr:cell wall / vacuolar inhibitor of fructosidase 1-like [Potentilla anserina]